MAFDILPVLGTNAIFICAGVPDSITASSNVDTDHVLLDRVVKNQVVLGTVNADKADFVSAIRDLAIFKRRWPQALRSLIYGLLSY